MASCGPPKRCVVPAPHLGPPMALRLSKQTLIAVLEAWNPKSWRMATEGEEGQALTEGQGRCEGGRAWRGAGAEGCPAGACLGMHVDDHQLSRRLCVTCGHRQAQKLHEHAAGKPGGDAEAAPGVASPCRAVLAPRRGLACWPAQQPKDPGRCDESWDHLLQTIENTRELVEDAPRTAEEVAAAEAEDEFADHFTRARAPKVLVTTCYRPTAAMYRFLTELLQARISGF